MAIKATTSVTLSCYRDTEAITRYYKLVSSDSEIPSTPTTNPPSDWDDSEPAYVSGNDDVLYFCDLTEFSDGTWAYSEVSKSSSYEAAKEAYNKANTAQDSANEAQSKADTADVKATNAQALINLLSDSISMLVRDENGESLMTQTEDGWIFSMKDTNDTLFSVSESLSQLQKDIGDTDDTVAELQKSVDTLGNISNYVKITTDGDQPCIELGTGNSNFKLRITNTDIRFMEGSSIPAYINNQSLYIKKAVVQEELRQGNFIWQIHNGRLGLIWREG